MTEETGTDRKTSAAKQAGIAFGSGLLGAALGRFFARDRRAADPYTAQWNAMARRAAGEDAVIDVEEGVILILIQHERPLTASELGGFLADLDTAWLNYAVTHGEEIAQLAVENIGQGSIRLTLRRIGKGLVGTATVLGAAFTGYQIAAAEPLIVVQPPPGTCITVAASNYCTTINGANVPAPPRPVSPPSVGMLVNVQAVLTRTRPGLRAEIDGEDVVIHVATAFRLWELVPGSRYSFSGRWLNDEAGERIAFEVHGYALV